MSFGDGLKNFSVVGWGGFGRIRIRSRGWREGVRGAGKWFRKFLANECTQGRHFIDVGCRRRAIGQLLPARASQYAFGCLSLAAIQINVEYQRRRHSDTVTEAKNIENHVQY